MKITRIGVDLAKHVFQVHGVDQDGHPVWKRQLTAAKIEQGSSSGINLDVAKIQAASACSRASKRSRTMLLSPTSSVARPLGWTSKPARLINR